MYICICIISKFGIWFIYSDGDQVDVGANDYAADIGNHGPLSAGYVHDPVRVAENPEGMHQGEPEFGHQSPAGACYNPARTDQLNHFTQHSEVGAAYDSMNVGNRDFVGFQEVRQLEELLQHSTFGRYIDNANSSNSEEETRNYQLITVEADQPETTRVANLELPIECDMPSRRLKQTNFMCEVTILDGYGNKHLVTMCHAHFHKTNFVSYSFACKMGFPHVNVNVGNKIETRCQIDTLCSNGKLFRGTFLPVAAIEHLVNMADCIALHSILTSKKDYLIIGTKMFELMMKENRSIAVQDDLVCFVEKKLNSFGMEVSIYK